MHTVFAFSTAVGFDSSTATGTITGSGSFTVIERCAVVVGATVSDTFEIVEELEEVTIRSLALTAESDMLA